MAAFRITNVTHQATKGRGHFLDFGKDLANKHIGVGGSHVIEAKSFDHLPDFVQDWLKKKWVRVHNLDEGGAAVGQVADGELTPSMINPVREMSGQDLDMDDEEPNLAEAHEAVLITEENTAPINQSTAQTRTRISEAAAEERHSTDISPIPGDKPVDLGDSANFTVRAGRSNQPGAVIGKNGR